MILEEYIIPFGGLKEGVYEYEFRAEDKFFAQFNNQDIIGGSIKTHLILLKKNNFLELDFHITGLLKLICDRCLDEFNMDIESKQKLYVRFGKTYEELSDNVVIIPEGETRLNIAQYIFEFSALSVPIKKVHPADNNGELTCNAEMLKLLDKYTSDQPEINPVWNNLRNILN